MEFIFADTCFLSQFKCHICTIYLQIGLHRSVVITTELSVTQLSQKLFIVS